MIGAVYQLSAEIARQIQRDLINASTDGEISTKMVVASLNSSTVVLPSTSGHRYWALLLTLIPLATIFGNVLVMLSVVRVRSLHTNVNYLIFGLAVADLLVAIAVMPYAVYVEFNRGVWLLGNFLCDSYCASDVSCSTASIITLAVISFDRYRAVTRPIEYARYNKDMKRVVYMMAGLWAVSLVLAAPMVLGINKRPANATDITECRFYNADFIIISSLISFAMPLIIILFVYARILLVLRRREATARRRRASQMVNRVKTTITVADRKTSQLTSTVAGIDDEGVTGTATAEMNDTEYEEEGEFEEEEELQEASRRHSFCDEVSSSSQRSSSTITADTPVEQFYRRYELIIRDDSKTGTRSWRRQHRPRRRTHSSSGGGSSTKRRQTPAGRAKGQAVLQHHRRHLQRRNSASSGVTSQKARVRKMSRSMDALAIPSRAIENAVDGTHGRQLMKGLMQSGGSARSGSSQRSVSLASVVSSASELLELVDDDTEISALRLQKQNVVEFHRAALQHQLNSCSSQASTSANVTWLSVPPQSVSERKISCPPTMVERSLISDNTCDCDAYSAPLSGLMMPSTSIRSVTEETTDVDSLTTFGSTTTTGNPPNSSTGSFSGGAQQMLFIDAEWDDEAESDIFHISGTGGSFISLIDLAPDDGPFGHTQELKHDSLILPRISPPLAVLDPLSPQDDDQSAMEQIEGTDVLSPLSAVTVSSSLLARSPVGPPPLLIIEVSPMVAPSTPSIASDVDDDSPSSRLRTSEASSASCSPSRPSSMCRSNRSSAGTSTAEQISEQPTGERTRLKRLSSLPAVRFSNNVTVQEVDNGDWLDAADTSSKRIRHGVVTEDDSLPNIRKSMAQIFLGSTSLIVNGALSVGKHAGSPMNTMRSVANSPANVMRFVKRQLYNREKSIRKKLSKNQRKEKKATKTLGIVVGVFLICWLPFFTLNVLNAVCIKLNEKSCQVGFLAFFLTTWLGYMNSFMNPIIYTVYNTEFRRAFKMILLPKRFQNQERRKNNIAKLPSGRQRRQ